VEGDPASLGDLPRDGPVQHRSVRRGDGGERPVRRDEQEQAAATLGASSWQTFWRVTLPSIRWGVAYGVVLTTARALGEIGAVLVVSSNVAGSTLTLPLLVFQRDSQPGSQAISGAYAAATELAVMSLIVLLVMTLLGPRRHDSK